MMLYISIVMILKKSMYIYIHIHCKNPYYKWIYGWIYGIHTCVHHYAPCLNLSPLPTDSASLAQEAMIPLGAFAVGASTWYRGMKMDGVSQNDVPPKKIMKMVDFWGWHPWILDVRIQNFEPIVMILRLREWRTILMMCPVHVWYVGTQTSEKLLLKWDLTIRQLMCCLGCLRWNPECSDQWLASRL